MKSFSFGCVWVGLAVMLLACSQVVAGELPSQGDASAAAGQPQVRADGGGLTADQSLALASVEPGAEEAYGAMTDTEELVVVITVCVIAVIVVAAAVGWRHWD